jgi:conjugal transfer ATP-binding protein TraC
MLKDFGKKIAAWLNEKNKFGVAPETKTTQKIISSIDHATLSSLLPYEAYDPETQLFINKKSLGFILEVPPLTGASEETVQILSSIVTDLLPQETDLQFLLWASDKIGPVLDYFEKQRSGRGEIFEWLAKKRTEYLKAGAYQSLFSGGSFLIRNFRLFIVVSQPRKKNQSIDEELVRIREEITSSLKSINMPSKPVAIEHFISLMHDLINPTKNVYPTQQNWNELDSISLQLTNPEYHISVLPHQLIFESTDEPWEARALTVKDFPKNSAQWKMTENIGQLFNTALQIPCPFVISLSLRAVSTEKANLNVQYKFIDKEKTARSPLAKFKPQINQEYNDWSFVRSRLSDGDRLVKIFYQVILYSPQKHANSNERKLRDLYLANGWRLRKESYLQLQSWLTMMPMFMSEGMYQDLHHFGRLRTVTAFNAINLAPLQGEWKGSETPNLVLPGRRGQLAIWNPFDNQEGNYNVAIAAASGKGKSMLTQEYITALVGSGGRVWVIDIGRSYEKTCKMLGGTFIEFNQQIQISLNPFTFIKDFEASLVMLKPLLAAMARPSSAASDEESAYLEKALKAAWQEHGNNASITSIAAWLNQQSSETCQNLSHLLYSFTADGMYGRYFEGTANINLNSQFVVLELQELKSKKDLQKIILLVLMYQISEAMYLGERHQKKSCIIDEVWDLLSGENDGAARFIETGFRTARRHNANFVTIAQSINDYYKNTASLAAFENADYKLILGQNPETIDQIKKSERMNMDAFTERLFKSLRKTDEYSECIIKSPQGISIHRIIFDPYSRILYSSKGDEFEAVKKLTKEGHSLRHAIEVVAEKKFNHA